MDKSIKVRYIVNKERKTIVCLLTNTEDAFYNFICKHNAKDFLTNILGGRNYKNISTMPAVFRGTAVCAPEDEWDEELGKKIAYSRARYKFDASFFNHANNFMAYIDKRLDQLSEQINNYGSRISHNHARRLQQLNDILENFELFPWEE